MRTTKIIIKNLFGIKEAALDGRSVELSGPKGAGKTSVPDQQPRDHLQGVRPL